MNSNNSIEAFCKKNGIPVIDIWYYIKETNGKKTPIGEKNNKPVEEVKTTINKNKKPTYHSYKKKSGKNDVIDDNGKQVFEKRFLTEKEVESLTLSHSLYLKHTENIYCLDIDDINIKSIDDLIQFNADFEFLRGVSYINGNTKGIHIYFKVKNMIEYTNQQNVINHITGDFIKKNNMWEKHGKIVNGSIDLIEFDYEDIKHIFNENLTKSTRKKRVVKIKTVVDGVEVEEEKEEIEFNDWEEIELDDNDRDLVKLLNPKRFHDYQDWIKMCWMFKNIGLDFDLFDEMSKTSPKYSTREDCLIQWDATKKAKINVGLLHYFCKVDNPIEYYKMFVPYIFNDKDDETKIKIQQRYLLPIDCEKIDNENDILQKNIIKFFNDDLMKVFNLKSPYDTGKTQLIKKILRTFNPKRVLWLSYRKTLTSDIMGNFETEFGFKDYQSKQYNANRLIIQLESILKIGSSMNLFTDDELVPYPEYDLVIIDEVESILKQFNSPTFKGNSKECFEFVQNVLMNSPKILNMDGDIGDRTYEFSKYFGNSINIVNDIKINPRRFIINENEIDYYNDIKQSLTDKKKIVIVSMSATMCLRYDEKIKSDFPDVNILCYTGKSDDRKKADFKDVLNKWDKCDVLIYSPTCESGVNFDKEHFNKIYGIFSNSTSSRQYFQMLARVRKITDNNIMILNETFDIGVNYNGKKIENRIFYTYDEVKESIILLENIELKHEKTVINGKVYKINKLGLYDNNYIYNKVEDLNNSMNTFLPNFHLTAIRKGHTVQYLNNSKGDEDEEKPTTHQITTVDMILSAPDINDLEYQELLEKQKKDEATEEDKISVDKHVWKKSLGVDKLCEGLLMTFTKESIKNFVSLIDEKNIKDFNDNQTRELKDKTKIIKSVIQQLGFNNIFDKNAVLEEQFIKNIQQLKQTNTIFTNPLNTKIRFGFDKEYNYSTMETMKEFLSFINTKIFNDYHIKVSYTRIQKDNVRYNAYKIETINGINELVEYRMMRGLNLFDTDNIRIIPNEKKYQYKDTFDNFETHRKTYLQQQKIKKDIEANKEKMQEHNEKVLQNVLNTFEWYRKERVELFINSFEIF